MPLNQVGTVSVPEPRMLTVQVWDKRPGQGGREGDPRRRPRPQPADRRPADPHPDPGAHRGAPQGTGQARRTNMPKHARVAVRNVRRDGMDVLKKAEKDDKISQDEHRQKSRRGAEADRPLHQADRRGAGAQGAGDHAGLMPTAPLPADARPASPGPAHVAIIMDGNGRWAKARGLPRVAGHRRGRRGGAPRSSRGAGELGIRYLTLFAFSSENWKRPADRGRAT